LSCLLTHANNCQWTALTLQLKNHSNNEPEPVQGWLDSCNTNPMNDLQMLLSKRHNARQPLL
jgi:hypothetical protein